MKNIHLFVVYSLNLAKYDEWKDTDVVEIATYLLDGVMQEFIDKTNGKDSMIRTHRHAKKGRALGLGVMGWHTFLQQKNYHLIQLLQQLGLILLFSDIRKKQKQLHVN
jgi:ribonucleoside-diphosphate reductase alpha chain